MFTYREDQGVYLLTEWVLCSQCCRMFSRNKEPHVIGFMEGMTLYQHVNCPLPKPVPLKLERGMK